MDPDVTVSIEEPRSALFTGNTSTSFGISPVPRTGSGLRKREATIVRQEEKDEDDRKLLTMRIASSVPQENRRYPPHCVWRVVTVHVSRVVMLEKLKPTYHHIHFQVGVQGTRRTLKTSPISLPTDTNALMDESVDFNFTLYYLHNLKSPDNVVWIAMRKRRRGRNKLLAVSYLSLDEVLQMPYEGGLELVSPTDDDSTAVARVNVDVSTLAPSLKSAVARDDEEIDALEEVRDTGGGGGREFKLQGSEDEGSDLDPDLFSDHGGNDTVTKPNDDGEEEEEAVPTVVVVDAIEPKDGKTKRAIQRVFRVKSDSGRMRARLFRLMSKSTAGKVEGGVEESDDDSEEEVEEERKKKMEEEKAEEERKKRVAGEEKRIEEEEAVNGEILDSMCLMDSHCEPIIEWIKTWHEAKPFHPMRIVTSTADIIAALKKGLAENIDLVLVVYRSDWFLHKLLRAYTELSTGIGRARSPPSAFRFAMFPTKRTGLAKRIAAADPQYNRIMNGLNVGDTVSETDGLELVNKARALLCAKYMRKIAIAEAVVTYLPEGAEETKQVTLPFVQSIQVGLENESVDEEKESQLNLDYWEAGREKRKVGIKALFHHLVLRRLTRMDKVEKADNDDDTGDSLMELHGLYTKAKALRLLRGGASEKESVKVDSLTKLVLSSPSGTGFSVHIDGSEWREVHLVSAVGQWHGRSKVFPVASFEEED